MGNEYIEAGDLAEIVGRSHFHHIPERTYVLR